MCGLNKLFLAPEVLQRKTKLSGKADVYSIGVILYSLVATDLQDILAFDTRRKQQKEIGRAILDFSEEQWEKYSENVK